jgi:hypothetical protein
MTDAAAIDLRSRIVPLIGERAVTLFADAVRAGDSDGPDPVGATEAEARLIRWGGALSSQDGVPADLAVAVETGFSEGLRVLLVEYAAVLLED